VSELKKRISVDSVDFGSVFEFTRILKATTGAMQPPRLVAALFMVLILVGAGRLWDAFTEPHVNPRGFLAAPLSVDDEERAQRVMWAAINQYVRTNHGDRPKEGEKLEAADVIRLIERVYRSDRENPAAPITARTELDQGYPDDVLKVRDQEFLAVCARIEAVAPKGAFAALSIDLVNSFNNLMRGVLYLEPARIVDTTGQVFIALPIALWKADPWFTVVYGLVALIVLSVGGGALCRMGAVEMAGQERLRVQQAYDFALGNWVKLILTPAAPLLIALALSLIIVLLGLFMAPWLDLIGGVLYGVALLFGFLLAFLLLGYLFALPLLLPAVACENCGPGDAQQRGYAYVISKPMRLIGYVLTGLVGMTIGYIVVALVATTMLNLTAGLFGVFTGNSAMSTAGGFKIFDLATRTPAEIHLSFHNQWAAWFVSFWQGLVLLLVTAYVFAYIFNASTIAYLLMRKACDGQDVEEVWRPGLAPGTLVPLAGATLQHPEGDAEPAPPAVTPRGGAAGDDDDDEESGGA
jgi:hypothetical protein